MRRGGSAAPRRIATIAAAALLASACAVGPASAQTGGTPLVRIPPAELAPLPAAKFPPAPRALLPTEIEVLSDAPGNGLVMRGALTGEAASATGVLRAIFLYSEAFDPTPSLQLVLADDDDRQAQALFSATIGGTPTLGIAIVTLSATGGDATVFYDGSDAFEASFPRLRQALAQADAAADPGDPADDCATAPQADTAADWDAPLAAFAAAKNDGNPLDGTAAQALVDRLSADTGHPWRTIPPAELR